MRLIPPNKLARFLKKVIYKNKYVYIDNWSIPHFFAGVWVATWALTWGHALTLLIIYEYYEVVLIGVLFKGDERIKNIIWDIIIGMAGWYIAINQII